MWWLLVEYDDEYETQGWKGRFQSCRLLCHLLYILVRLPTGLVFLLTAMPDLT